MSEPTAPVTTAVATPEVITPTPLYAEAKREPRLISRWEYMAAFHQGGDNWKKRSKTLLIIAIGTSHQLKRQQAMNF